MKKIQSFALILGVLTMSVAVGYLALAWTDAPGDPPGCPVDYPGCNTPLNVSLTAQAKQGALVLGANPAVETGLVVQYGNVGIGEVEPGARLYVKTTDLETTPFEVEALVSRLRQIATITNPGDAQTFYQVLVNMDTASLIAANEMRADCGDLRFTDSDEVTNLNYWIESGCGTAFTRIWVEIPSLPASSQKTIYIKYKNPEAEPISAFIAEPDRGIDTGTGADGACSVAGTTNLNAGTCVGRANPDMAGFTTESPIVTGSTSLNLTTAPSGLTAGDEVLIINLQGSATEYANAGKYETKRVESINGVTLNFSSPFMYSFDGTTQKIMVQRVPQYTNVTVPAGTTLTADGWNGTKGGVLFFRATGTVTVGGTIDMLGKGYRGGTLQSPGSNWGSAGYVGETYRGGTYQAIKQQGAVLGGGGGGIYGCCDLAGGGGGGYGGNGAAGTTGSASGGAGGGSYGVANLSTIFLGSAGANGAGWTCWCDTPGQTTSVGGNGGGAVLIAADTFNNSGGTIRTNGGVGSVGYSGGQLAHGGSGGGAGGSIRFQVGAFSNSGTISSVGGAAASGVATNGTWKAGGAGGVGRIATYYTSSFSGSTNPSSTNAVVEAIPTVVLGEVEGSEAEQKTVFYIEKGTGNVGIGMTKPQFALDVAGEVFATSFPASSDVRLKENITPITASGSILDKLDNLQGIFFNWNETYKNLGRATPGKQVGLIAQEVEKEFPELITTWGEENYQTVDYGRFTAVLLEAIKELREQVKEQQGRIEELENSMQSAR
jgi:hypothetical protein